MEMIRFAKSPLTTDVFNEIQRLYPDIRIRTESNIDVFIGAFEQDIDGNPSQYENVVVIEIDKPSGYTHYGTNGWSGTDEIVFIQRLLSCGFCNVNGHIIYHYRHDGKVCYSIVTGTKIDTEKLHNAIPSHSRRITQEYIDERKEHLDDLEVKERISSQEGVDIDEFNKRFDADNDSDLPF